MMDAVGRMLQLLAQSLQADEPTRSQAERELQAMQRLPPDAGFLSGLLDAVVGHGQQTSPLDANVRLLACLWLKHHLKNQSKQVSNVWSPHQRAELRRVLLGAALQESQATIALHFTLIVAQIARSEFPTHWPMDQLFTPMLSAVNNTNGDNSGGISDQQLRGINVLYRVVKELATRRLMVHRKQFALLSIEILPRVLQFWCAATNGELSSISDLTVLERRLQAILLSSKVLAIVFLTAFRELVPIQNGALVRTAFVQFYEQLDRLLQFRRLVIHSSSEGAQVLVDKCAYRLASIVVGIQKSYPVEFRDYLTPFLNLFWSVLVQQQTSALVLVAPRRLHIEALQFLANVLSTRLYKTESLSSASGSLVTKVITATGDVALTDAMVLEAHAEVQTFFSCSEDNGSSRFQMLVNVVVLQHMRLSDTDLDEWQADPEAYSILGESLTAQESVRACAENLLLTLIQHFPDETIPVLKQMTSAAASFLVELARPKAPVVPNDARILDMDAILLAIGLGCYDLHDCFDFEPWFIANLVPLLVPSSTSKGMFNGLPVLPSRIVWLVSCWLAQLSANVRPPLYDALLNVSTLATADAALRLRIVQTLESMLNDWGFEHEAFAPFVSRALECLYSFFPLLLESESKLKILTCLEAMIQACGSSIVGFCQQISTPLPSMWTSDSEASNLVRGKILQLLTKLLQSVKENQQQISDQDANVQALVAMCVQVVRLATDLENPDEVFLMESGLELWVETTIVSRVYTEELHLLFVHVLRLIERDYEHVNLAMNLLEQYVRLGQSQFWQTYHATVVAMLVDVVGNVKAEACVEIAKSLELMVAVLPSEQLTTCVPIFNVLIETCVAFQQSRASSGSPKASPRRASDMVVVAFVSVLARLLLQHSEFTLMHLLQGDLRVLVLLIDLLLGQFFYVAALGLSRKKLWALGLCSTLVVVKPELLDKLGQILEVCVEVLDDEEQEQQLRPSPRDSDSGGGGAAYRAYASRREPLPEQDAAVRAMDLKAIVCNRLNELAVALGSQAFEQLLQTCDGSVLRRLQQ